MEKKAGHIQKIARTFTYFLSDEDRRANGGIFLKVAEVGYDGKWWYFAFEKSNKNSYSDEHKFKYVLAQELMSLQKASKIMEELRNEYLKSQGLMASESMDRKMVASELVAMAKELMGYGYHKTYGGDPYWLTLKYPSHCHKCHKELKRGEKAFYYPRDKSMFGESCGHGEEADKDFHSMVEQEEGHLIDY